jgi:hypothetical protein
LMHKKIHTKETGGTFYLTAGVLVFFGKDYYGS